jgi:hypothetical protein
LAVLFARLRMEHLSSRHASYVQVSGPLPWEHLPVDNWQMLCSGG